MASYVGLNVGGTIYKTSRTTLTGHPDSFFTSLLSGQIPSARDEHGNYQIDRDGQIFRHVLNYLRDNKLVLPDEFKELGLLDQEADFFQLVSLKAEIQALREATLAESVCLNVGGTFYQTTKEVLSREPESIFRHILNDDSPPLSGKYFIPGDGELFRYILSFLRFGCLSLPPPRFSDVDLNLLEAEAKSLELHVLLVHVLTLRLIYQRSSDLGRGVAMFARENQFVFYSNDRTLLAALTGFGRCSLPVETIKTAWQNVYVVAFQLDLTKVGRQVYMQELRVNIQVPANKDDMVEILASHVGRPFIQKLYTATYFSIFGWNSDIVVKYLKEII